MPALATKLVNKFAGAAGTSSITITTPGTYDPLANTRSASTTVTHADTDVSPPVPVTNKMVTDIGAILKGDMMTIIDGAQLTITKAMINNLILTYQGVKFTMIHLKELYSGANVAAYEVFLRDV